VTSDPPRRIPPLANSDEREEDGQKTRGRGTMAWQASQGGNPIRFLAGSVRRDQLFDRGKDGSEFFVVFLLQTLDLACEIGVAVQSRRSCTLSTLDNIATPCSVKAYGR